MLETLVERQIIFYIVGIVAAVGVVARITAGISLRRLVRAAGNMNKSSHALMRLVRAKFEHACMVSDKVQNVRAFVEKYLYEYRVLGIRLHTWRRIEKASVWLYGILVLAGAGADYWMYGNPELLLPYGVAGGAGVLVLFFLYISMDEKYQMEAAKMYMVDFLENTYAHRYAKNHQKEIQVTVQRSDGEYRPEEPEEELEEDMAEDIEEEAEQEVPELPPEDAKILTADAGQEPAPGRKKENAYEPAMAASAPAEGRTNPPERKSGPAEEKRGLAEEKTELPKEARIREILEEFLVS